MNLSSLQILVLHPKGDLFWEAALCYNCTVFRILGFRYKLWKSGVNLIKFHKFPIFINIINGNVGGNLVRPWRPCWACFGLWLEHGCRHLMWRTTQQNRRKDKTFMKRYSVQPFVAFHYEGFQDWRRVRLNYMQMVYTSYSINMKIFCRRKTCFPGSSWKSDSIYSQSSFLTRSDE